MTRKLSTVVVLLASMLSLTVLASCQSAQPFGFTGSAMSDRARYTDDKGKFHEELYVAGRPLR